MRTIMGIAATLSCAMMSDLRETSGPGASARSECLGEPIPPSASVPPPNPISEQELQSRQLQYHEQVPPQTPERNSSYPDTDRAHAIGKTEQDPRQPPLDEDGNEIPPNAATRVTWPTPTTGVAGTIAQGPSDAGSLNPANVPAPSVKDEAQMIWARFKQMAHIPPGRTVRPGEVAQIPESHLHPDLHEELDEDDPAIPGNGPKEEVDSPHATAIDPDLRDELDWLHRRVCDLEDRGGGTSQPQHAYPKRSG